MLLRGRPVGTEPRQPRPGRGSNSVERMRGLTRGFCELTLEARDLDALADFYKDVQH